MLHHALRRQLSSLRSPAALRAGGFLLKDVRFERSMSSIWNESMSCKTMTACLVMERMHECQKRITLFDLIGGVFESEGFDEKSITPFDLIWGLLENDIYIYVCVFFLASLW